MGRRDKQAQLPVRRSDIPKFVELLAELKSFVLVATPPVAVELG